MKRIAELNIFHLGFLFFFFIGITATLWVVHVNIVANAAFSKMMNHICLLSESPVCNASIPHPRLIDFALHQKVRTDLFIFATQGLEAELVKPFSSDVRVQTYRKIIDFEIDRKREPEKNQNQRSSGQEAPRRNRGYII